MLFTRNVWFETQSEKKEIRKEISQLIKFFYVFERIFFIYNQMFSNIFACHIKIQIKFIDK